MNWRHLLKRADFRVVDMKNILRKAVIAVFFIISFSIAASAADFESGWGKALEVRDVEARAFLKKAAQGICAPEDSDYEKVRKLNEYVCLNADYDYGNNASGIADFVFNGKAICSGYAETLAYLLDCVNVKNFTITAHVYTGSGSKTLHIWNVVYVDGKWLHVDPTWNDATRSSANPNGKYFLISGEEIFANREKSLLVKTEDYDNFYNFIRTASVSFNAGEALDMSKHGNREYSRSNEPVKEAFGTSASPLKNIQALTVREGRVLAPLRDIAFALGGYVRQESGGTASVILGTRTLVMKSGALEGTIDGDIFTFDVPPQLIDGVFMVPVRTAFEKLGAKVTYNEITSEVTVSFDPHMPAVNLLFRPDRLKPGGLRGDCRGAPELSV